MEETIKESMKEDVTTSARSSPPPSGSQETSYPILGTSTYKAISDDSKCDYIVYIKICTEIRSDCHPLLRSAETTVVLTKQVRRWTPSTLP